MVGKTIAVKGKEYGLLVDVDAELQTAVYLIPVEEWEQNNLDNYVGTESHRLPASVAQKVKRGEYAELQVASVVSL